LPVLVALTDSLLERGNFELRVALGFSQGGRYFCREPTPAEEPSEYGSDEHPEKDKANGENVIHEIPFWLDAPLRRRRIFLGYAFIVNTITAVAVRAIR
jgi:hypothetical protein